MPSYSGISKTSKAPNMDLLGRWPVSTRDAWDTRRMIPIPPDKFLNFIHGKDRHILVTFFVSNDIMHVGILTLAVRQVSDPEVHKGDETLYVLKGTLLVRVFDEGEIDSSVSHVGFEVGEGEKMLIPEGVNHQYFNLTDTVTKVFFAVAPEL